MLVAIFLLKHVHSVLVKSEWAMSELTWIWFCLLNVQQLHQPSSFNSVGKKKELAASALTIFFDLAISWENHCTTYICFAWSDTPLTTPLRACRWRNKPDMRLRCSAIPPFALPFTSLCSTSYPKGTLASMPAIWCCGLLFSSQQTFHSQTIASTQTNQGQLKANLPSTDATKAW